MARLATLAALLVALAVTHGRAAPPTTDPIRLELTLEGQRVFVLAPARVALADEVDLFVYLHGLDGYYWRRGKDNALEATGLAPAVATLDRDLVVILPEARRGDADRSVALQRVLNRPGGAERLIDTALAALAGHTGRPAPRVRAIGLAAHSGGGGMIGPTLAPEGGRFGALVTDVTLMDAGYPYRRSWELCRDWLAAGPAGKTLRIFHGGDAGASFAVGFFSRDNPAPRPAGLRRYTGVAPALAARALTLTPEQLGSFEVGDLDFELLELTRADHPDGRVHARFGSALAEGHWRIRDATLVPAARAVGRGPDAWRLAR
ncbi:MAG: hypothetical protein IT385_25145 [Deltaproteobacteria bacterium]|nr:hypothetical protein [Deltaproteobacteria bacterium]